MHFLNKKIVIALGALAALVVLYHATPFSRAVQALVSPAATAGSPLYKTGRAIGAWGSSVFRGSELRSRITEQDAEIAQLARGAAGAELPAQNSLGIPSVPARVLALNESGGVRTLLLSAGRADGIVPGAAVFTPEGVFVGKTIRVLEHASLALPVTDSQSAVAASISGDRSVQAVVRGRRGLGFYMELISQDASIEQGDVAVTSLLEENTPAGLLLGTVAAVAYAEGALFKSADLTPFVSLSSVSAVEIYAPVPE